MRKRGSEREVLGLKLHSCKEAAAWSQSRASLAHYSEGLLQPRQAGVQTTAASAPTPGETPHLCEVHRALSILAAFEMGLCLPEVRGQHGPCSPSTVSNSTVILFLGDFSYYSQILTLSTYCTSQVTHITRFNMKSPTFWTSPGHASTDPNLAL